MKKNEEELIFEYKDPMPQGMGNAYWFQIFNSMVASVVIALPMMLYFRGLGASGTVLGVVASLPPLLMILQIPSVRFLERTGYRKFVLQGWTIQSFFVMGMAVVPLMPESFGWGSKMAWMLFFLVCFNASRGFSSSGLLPWMTQLVPEQARGRYVSADQMCVLASTVVSSLIMAGVLGWANAQDGFALVFGIAAGCALISLFFLGRIPDVPLEQEASSTEKVPWKSLLGYQPFLKFLVFNFLIHAAMACGGLISVPMIRDHFGAADSSFMVLNSIWGLFFLLGAFFSRKTLDRVGSKPLLVLALLVQILHYLGWILLAGFDIPFDWWSMSFQQMTRGVGFALFQVANIRLAMALVPTMGRSHFFAIFTVSNSLTVGLFSIIWGVVFDGISSFHQIWGGWELNVYTLLYLVMTLIAVGAIWRLHGVPEVKTMKTRDFFHELFVKKPQRVVSRLFERSPLS
jgi:MFS family permease